MTDAFDKVTPLGSNLPVGTDMRTGGSDEVMFSEGPGCMTRSAPRTYRTVNTVDDPGFIIITGTENSEEFERETVTMTCCRQRLVPETPSSAENCGSHSGVCATSVATLSTGNRTYDAIIVADMMTNRNAMKQSRV